MQDPAQQQPQPTPQQPKGSSYLSDSTAGKRQKATLAVTDDYDLTRIVQDRSDIIIRTQQFWDEVIIPVDRLYRQKDPTDPYLKAGVGQKQPAQYTHPLITHFVTKGVPFMLSKGVTVHCPQDANPACAVSNLVLAEKLIRTTWHWNETRIPGRNDIRRRAKLIALQGGYAVNYAYLEGDDATIVNDGYPIVSQLYSLLDVQYEVDNLGSVKRVIVSKRRRVSELPEDWQGDHNPTEDVDVFEHFDRVNHGVVINGTEIVKPLTPHGYYDRMTHKPLCPWVICLHDPDEYVRGDADLTSVAITQLKTIVGHPPVEHLIPITRHLSYLLTLVRYTTTEAALPYHVIKGDFQIDQARRTFLSSQANPQDGVEYLNNTQSIPAMMQVAEFFQAISQQGVMSDGLFSGQVKEISGTSAQQQTDMVKGVLDEMQRTLETHMAQEGEMILSLVASNTMPSTADLYKQKYGKPLPANSPEDSLNYTNGQPMPLSEIVTGNTYDTITSANLKGIVTVEVNIEPYDKLPKEQRWQTGVQFLMSDKSPFDPVEVLSTFMDYDNAQATYERGLLSKMTQNPALPFADLMALRALVAQKEGEYDPTVTEKWRTSIDQAEMKAVDDVITKKLQALSQGQTVGSSPQPGQQPPQQGQPQQPSPMQPMPQGPPPQGPPPGMPQGPPMQQQPPGPIGPMQPGMIPGMSSGMPMPVQPPAMGI